MQPTDNQLTAILLCCLGRIRNYLTVLPIAFCPTGELRDKMRLDYEAMKTSMIYGEKLSFDALIDRLEQLENRFRSIPM